MLGQTLWVLRNEKKSEEFNESVIDQVTSIAVER